MSNNESFVAYEYKNITVNRDSVAIYTDCLSNFGWELIDEHEYGYGPARTGASPVNASVNPHAYTVQAPPDKVDGPDMVALKFKRDRRIDNKLEINRLERKCEEALAAIRGLERKSSAYTMGASLGAGIVGAAFIGFGVYNFIASNIVVGVLLTIVGVAGWAIGFFAHNKVGKKKSAQTDPMIQEQLDIAYSACEQAHALLA